MSNALPDDVLASMAQRRRAIGTGPRRWLFPGLWLIYLGQTVGGVHDHATGAAAVAGYAIVGAFSVLYLSAIETGWTGRIERFRAIYVAMIGLTVVECLIARHDALVFLVYLGVLTVAGFSRYTVPIIAVFAAVTALSPLVVPGWEGEPDIAGAIAVALVPLAMWGFFGVMRTNVALAAARAEVARLAAENERSRIARDLHDLLGHSLTTVTVKAGLARRLAERGEMERAAREVGEVEALARRTLGEVRAAVAGYHDVTLVGEIASAREVLRAAGVEADLPGAVDIVAEDAAEHFGWVVRETVTNIVRHARATRCTITLGPRWIEIVDDGVGAGTGCGTGLAGLADRLAAVGGTVEAGGRGSGGWRVRAELPEPGEAPEPGDAPEPTEAELPEAEPTEADLPEAELPEAELPEPLPCPRPLPGVAGLRS